MRGRKPKSRSASGQSRPAIVPNPNLQQGDRPRPKDDPEPVEIRVAHIGLIGGLLAAILAAIIGAIIAGYFQLSSTNKQAKNSENQARTDFTRSQRQAAYTSFLKDAQSYEKTLDQLTSKLMTQDPAKLTPTTLQQILDDSDYDKAHDNIELDIKSLQVIGSDSSFRIASDIANKGNQVYVLCTSLIPYTPIVGKSINRAISERKVGMNKMEFDFADATKSDLDKFVQTAKDDIK
jgi:hypothetical protein